VRFEFSTSDVAGERILNWLVVAEVMNV